MRGELVGVRDDMGERTLRRATTTPMIAAAPHATGCMHCVACCDPPPVTAAARERIQARWASERERKLHFFFHTRRGGGRTHAGAFVVRCDGRVETYFAPGAPFSQHQHQQGCEAQSITADVLYREASESVCAAHPTHSALRSRRRTLKALAPLLLPYKTTNVALTARVQDCRVTRSAAPASPTEALRADTTPLAPGTLDASRDEFLTSGEGSLSSSHSSLSGAGEGSTRGLASTPPSKGWQWEPAAFQACYERERSARGAARARSPSPRSVVAASTAPKQRKHAPLTAAALPIPAWLARGKGSGAGAGGPRARGKKPRRGGAPAVPEWMARLKQLVAPASAESK